MYFPFTWLQFTKLAAVYKVGCSLQSWLQFTKLAAVYKVGCSSQSWLQFTKLAAVYKVGCSLQSYASLVFIFSSFLANFPLLPVPASLLSFPSVPRFPGDTRSCLVMKSEPFCHTSLQLCVCFPAHVC